MAVLLAEGGLTVQLRLDAPASIDSETTYVTRQRSQQYWNGKPVIAPDQAVVLANHRIGNVRAQSSRFMLEMLLGLRGDVADLASTLESDNVNCHSL
jgi:hypothetical protein